MNCPNKNPTINSGPYPLLIFMNDKAQELIVNGFLLAIHKFYNSIIGSSSFFKSSLLESPRGVRKKNYNSKREDLKEEDQ